LINADNSFRGLKTNKHWERAAGAAGLSQLSQDVPEFPHTEKTRRMMTKKETNLENSPDPNYDLILGDISTVIDEARRSVARSINCIMTAAYWLIGRRIVEFEQNGKVRAEYGKKLLERLAGDLSAKFGRGFSYPNLNRFRQFYLTFPLDNNLSTALIESNQPILSTPSRELGQPVDTPLVEASKRFTLPWSAYVRLLSVKNENARDFYETEAFRAGWSVRQLDRQINSQFYERTALSKNKAAMLRKGQKALRKDRVLPEEEIKNPYVLEFLNLKDEYSETDLEEALIRHLETFLLELGGDFCFIGRQKRLRIGDEWYRVDLVFFHRRLRCLVIIDLKIGKFTHADAGQMHLYLNYARERWVHEDENPPVGLILCAQKDEAVARYALEGLPNKVMASEYRTALPDEKELAAEIKRTQAMLQERKMITRTSSEVGRIEKSKRGRRQDKGIKKGKK
jgi:predicted nuclease of restriction endonuclease-like (RecB) superfamily